MGQKLDDPGTAFCVRKEMLKNNDEDTSKGHRSQLEGALTC